MGVAVLVAVTELRRRTIGRVSQVRGDLDQSPRLHRRGRRAERSGHRVALGQQRQGDRGVREGEAGLGEPDELHGPRGRFGDQESRRVRETDVFAREDDQSASQEPSALATLEQGHQPVQRRVRVRTAHRLDQRTHLVVVGVGGLVVETSVPRSSHVFEFDGGAVVLHARQDNRGVESGERAARVAVGRGGNGRQRLLGDRGAAQAEAPTHQRGEVVLT